MLTCDKLCLKYLILWVKISLKTLGGALALLQKHFKTENVLSVQNLKKIENYIFNKKFWSNFSFCPSSQDCLVFEVGAVSTPYDLCFYSVFLTFCMKLLGKAHSLASLSRSICRKVGNPAESQVCKLLILTRIERWQPHGSEKTPEEGTRNMKEALLCGYPSCVPLLWAADSRHCVPIKMKQETCILLRCRESAVFTQGSSPNPDAVVGFVHVGLASCHERQLHCTAPGRKRKETLLSKRSPVLYLHNNVLWSLVIFYIFYIF